MESNDLLKNTADHTHSVSNGKTELSLNELAEIQPGMARLMVEISPKMSICWWAAKYRNFELATFQLNETIKLLKTSVVVRPKYTEDIYDFIEKHMTILKNLLLKKDLDEFFTEFESMTAATNNYHEKYNKGFIVWKVSDNPPEYLDLTPKN